MMNCAAADFVVTNFYNCERCVYYIFDIYNNDIYLSEKNLNKRII